MCVREGERERERERERLKRCSHPAVLLLCCCPLHLQLTPHPGVKHCIHSSDLLIIPELCLVYSVEFSVLSTQESCLFKNFVSRRTFVSKTFVSRRISSKKLFSSARLSSCRFTTLVTPELDFRRKCFVVRCCVTVLFSAPGCGNLMKKRILLRSLAFLVSYCRILGVKYHNEAVLDSGYKRVSFCHEVA